MRAQRGTFIPRGKGRFVPLGDDIPEPDTGPLDPIATVTSTASKLYDWPTWALIALALYLGYKFYEEG